MKEQNNDAACNCIEQDYFTCVDGDVYWFNSCGANWRAKQACANNERCDAGQCQFLGCEVDAFEDNDFLRTATSLELGQVIPNLNLCDDANDIFVINLSYGQFIDIETYGLDGQRSIDVINPVGQLLAASARGAGKLNRFKV